MFNGRKIVVYYTSKITKLATNQFVQLDLMEFLKKLRCGLEKWRQHQADHPQNSLNPPRNQKLAKLMQKIQNITQIINFERRAHDLISIEI
jgi:hypothetical protein